MVRLLGGKGSAVSRCVPSPHFHTHTPRRQATRDNVDAGGRATGCGKGRRVRGPWGHAAHATLDGDRGRSTSSPQRQHRRPGKRPCSPPLPPAPTPATPRSVWIEGAVPPPGRGHGHGHATCRPREPPPRPLPNRQTRNNPDPLLPRPGRGWRRRSSAGRRWGSAAGRLRGPSQRRRRGSAAPAPRPSRPLLAACGGGGHLPRRGPCLSGRGGPGGAGPPGPHAALTRAHDATSASARRWAVAAVAPVLQERECALLWTCCRTADTSKGCCCWKEKAACRCWCWVWSRRSLPRCGGQAW